MRLQAHDELVFDVPNCEGLRQALLHIALHLADEFLRRLW
jgi:hypothetical protein